MLVSCCVFSMNSAHVSMTIFSDHSLITLGACMITSNCTLKFVQCYPLATLTVFVLPVVWQMKTPPPPFWIAAVAETFVSTILVDTPQISCKTWLCFLHNLTRRSTICLSLVIIPLLVDYIKTLRISCNLSPWKLWFTITLMFCIIYHFTFTRKHF